MDEAEAAMQAELDNSRRAQGLAPTASTPIMYWYQNVDYNNYAPQPDENNRMTTIYGGAPCDTAGYKVDPDSWWAANVTSVAGNSNCYVARVYNRALNDADDFNIHVGQRGHWLERFNDNVGRFQVHS